MKKALLILSVILLSFTTVQSKGLNSNAQRLKKVSLTDYNKTIRTYAIKEWKQDHRMIVYEINKQSDALVWIVKEFEARYAAELVGAIRQWSRKGKADDNIETLSNNLTISFETLLMLHCDWGMVKYEYEKQTEAAEAY